MDDDDDEQQRYGDATILEPIVEQHDDEVNRKHNKSHRVSFPLKDDHSISYES